MLLLHGFTLVWVRARLFRTWGEVVVDDVDVVRFCWWDRTPRPPSPPLQAVIITLILHCGPFNSFPDLFRQVLLLIWSVPFLLPSGKGGPEWSPWTWPLLPMSVPVSTSPLLGLGFGFDAPLAPAVKSYCEGEATLGQAHVEVALEGRGADQAPSPPSATTGSEAAAHLNTVLLHVQRKKRLDELLQVMGPYLTSEDGKVRSHGIMTAPHPDLHFPA